MIVLAPVLLRLADAIGAEGDAVVVRLLAEELAVLTGFEAGEIVVAHGGRLHRRTLAGPEEPVVAADLLANVMHARHPMRIDEPAEAAPFPETRAILERRGLRSLLALPVTLHGGPGGAVVIARDFSWSLVGVSLTRAAPLAAMAGIALERSLALAEAAGSRPTSAEAAPFDPERQRIAAAMASAMAERESRLAEAQAWRDEATAQLGEAQAQVAAVREQLAAAQSQLAAAQARVRELEARRNHKGRR